MNSEIRLLNIQKKENKVVYEYKIKGEIENYVRMDKEFFIEYEENIEAVPNSILVIPFLCNLLPIIWVTDTTLYIQEVDKDFYYSIPDFKKGYEDMYPTISFKGNLQYEILEDNSYKAQEKSALFFSGGVDAVSSLVTHIKEELFTITVWGADIKVDNIVGWNRVKESIQENAIGKANTYIKSSFRDFLKEQNLTALIYAQSKENWWHGFQHGIGLIGLSAPLAYIKKLKKIYIASTYTIKDKGKVTCASDPTIDNYVKMASCCVVHDGYEFDRQNKIRNICEYRKNTHQNIKVRVCWKASTGENCSKCEKCIRTIMGIVAEGEDATQYGFKVDYSYIKHFLEHRCYFDKIIYPLWQDILKRFEDNKELLKNNKEIQWFYHIDFDKLNRRYQFFPKRVMRGLKRRIKKYKEEILCRN